MAVAKPPAVIFLLFFALPALSQKEIVSITNWRVHAGDNPAWANPAFDDSAWARPKSPPVSSFAEENAEGWHWYRAAIHVPDDLRGQDLAIGMAPLDDVYGVYIDGVPIGRFGSFEPAPQASYPKHFVFQIAKGMLQGPTGHIAVRRFRHPWTVRLNVFSAAGTALFNHPPRLGTVTAIEALERLDMAKGAIQMLPADLTDVLFLFAAAISFVLYELVGGIAARPAQFLCGLIERLDLRLLSSRCAPHNVIGL